ncbi:MAG: hypothetical protein JRH01_19470 [Deltaproteobacteria bacterium]|nr:hypothetical protein [Deltaproteobacteria bacterium]MBW2395530.1 hypothetical protein [Deltaproteobacteria bacterium]
MTKTNRRLTRRDIMRGTAALPIVALAQCALTNPSEENMAAVRSAAKKEIPPGQLKGIVNRAHALYGVDKDDFECIAVTLWSYFALGVRLQSAEAVKIDDAKLIPMAAFNYNSGNFLAVNLKNGNYPKNCNDTATNVCAYSCGEHAARIAMANVPAEAVVTKKTYEAAWEATKTEMALKLTRAAAISRNSPAAEGDDDPTLHTGFGCG